MNKTNINQPLPSKFGPKINKETADKYIKDFLKHHLPDSDKHQVGTEENWRFPLERIGDDRKRRKVKSHKKKLLSRNEKRKLGLSKLTKTGWDYSKILPMNKIWIGYMDENLEFAKRAPTWTEADYTSFCAVLNKSELIGAEISIIRSSTPSYIGIRGIIVYETKFTFQIVSSDSKFKVIIKDRCVFLIYLWNMKFTIYGKSLLTRPSDRSIKKIKSYISPDL